MSFGSCTEFRRNRIAVPETPRNHTDRHIADEASSHDQPTDHGGADHPVTELPGDRWSSRPARSAPSAPCTKRSSPNFISRGGRIPRSRQAMTNEHSQLRNQRLNEKELRSCHRSPPLFTLHTALIRHLCHLLGSHLRPPRRRPPGHRRLPGQPGLPDSVPFALGPAQEMPLFQSDLYRASRGFVLALHFDQRGFPPSPSPPWRAASFS